MLLFDERIEWLPGETFFREPFTLFTSEFGVEFRLFSFKLLTPENVLFRFVDEKLALERALGGRLGVDTMFSAFLSVVV